MSQSRPLVRREDGLFPSGQTFGAIMRHLQNRRRSVRYAFDHDRGQDAGTSFAESALVFRSLAGCGV